MRTIVVGVDDSRGARAALDWALDEARRHGARVEVLHAFEVEIAWIDAAESAKWSELQREAAQAVLSTVIEGAGAPAAGEIDARVVEGNPVTVLVEASEHADLLVVGSRGRGGLRGLLLGSVSQRCVERARCPVVVVPPPG
jgi:nucleotide-binding universal stress UspA family protein